MSEVLRDCKEFVTPNGDPYKTIFVPQVKPDGVVVLVDSGYESLFEYIQSFKESTLIENILARFRNGEVDVLQRHQGIYADISEMPRTYAELLQKVIDGQNYFDSLPVEVRKKFNFDFGEWFASTGSLDWFDKMGVNMESAAADGERESNEEKIVE